MTLIRGKLFIFDGGVTASTTNSQHPRNILALDNIKLSTDPAMPKEFKIHYGAPIFPSAHAIDGC